jgi:4-nitrophenyl phosphatase
MPSTELKALLLDMDGVLWRGSESIGNLPAVFTKVQSKGLKMAFVTNNATRTVEQYLEVFHGFGVPVAAELVHTSANVTAQILKEQHPAGGKVYVIGERGLQEAMKDQGFEIADENCVAVVVGLDRNLTYDKLKHATQLIRGGAAFIGTNPDRTLPSPLGEVPGAGSILAALEAATDVRATVIGKPERALLDSALKQLSLDPRQALMVGDRVETDVAAGQKAGCRTALVLSGVTSESAARAWKPAIDFIERDVETLLDKI